MPTQKIIPAHYQIIVELPGIPQSVFTHITNLAAWWPEEVEGEDLQQDIDFILRVGDGHYSKNRVVEFVQGQRLVWMTTESLRKSDGYDWSGTRFIFELTPKGANTLVSFTYDGVVLEEEQERLAEICNYCIHDRLYKLVAGHSPG